MIKPEAMVGGTNSPGEWDVIFHSAETLRLIQYWDVDTMLVKQLSSVARKPQVGHIPVYYDNQVRFTHKKVLINPNHNPNPNPNRKVYCMEGNKCVHAYVRKGWTYTSSKRVNKKSPMIAVMKGGSKYEK